VADQSGGLRIVDVSDPADPFEVGVVDNPAWALDVAVSGFSAYVATGAAGLRVIDVFDPASPFEVGSVDTPGFASGVVASDRHVFVADGAAGMEIFWKCGVPIFFDGFESGDTSAWSHSVP
jgi:hypothetical protein